MYDANKHPIPLKKNHKLEHIEKIKLLVVAVDHKMKLPHQANYIENKVSNSIGGLLRVKDILPQLVRQQ